MARGKKRGSKSQSNSGNTLFAGQGRNRRNCLCHLFPPSLSLLSLLSLLSFRSPPRRGEWQPRLQRRACAAQPGGEERGGPGRLGSAALRSSPQLSPFSVVVSGAPCATARAGAAFARGATRGGGAARAGAGARAGATRGPSMPCCGFLLLDCSCGYVTRIFR